MKPGKVSRTFEHRLDALLDEHGKKAYDRAGKPAPRKTCAIETQKDRRWFYRQVFRELAELGYPVEHPGSLKGKHIQALADKWQAEGVAVGTLHTRMSRLRVFALWVGKPGLVRENGHYFPEKDLKRRSAATVNRAWEPNGVLPQEIVDHGAELDRRFGLMLRLQQQFGLRVKESMMMCPLRAVAPDGENLLVVDGTKGGLPRMVPIRTDAQRALITEIQNEAAKSRTKRLMWEGLTFQQARNRFYYLAGKVGITKAELGVTAHGLRHGYAQTRAKDGTGALTPIEGGRAEDTPAAKRREVAQQVSLELGHRRPDVVNFYYGSFAHQNRAPIDTQWQLNKWGVGA